MHKNQKGFSIVEACIILFILVLVGFAGWYVWRANQKDSDKAKETKTSETTDKKTGKKSGPDPTDGWVAYSNAEGDFSFRHPASWSQAANPELCTGGLALFGANAASTGHCASEDGGQMQMSSVAGDERANYQFDAAYYTGATSEPVTIEGVTGVKLGATVMGMEDEALVGGLPDGTAIVRYLFFTGGRTYIISYVQTPAYPDALSDFNLLATHTFRFHE